MAKKQCTEEDYYNESRRLRAETSGSGDCPAIRCEEKFLDEPSGKAERRIWYFPSPRFCLLSLNTTSRDQRLE